MGFHTEPRQRSNRPSSVAQSTKSYYSKQKVEDQLKRRQLAVEWRVRWTAPVIFSVFLVVIWIRWHSTDHVAVEQQEHGNLHNAANTHQTNRLIRNGPVSSPLTKRNVVTIYMEPYTCLKYEEKPLPRRTTSAAKLQAIEFPEVSNCSILCESFPIDAFPERDPFLPWIHDLFLSPDGSHVRFVAQNKRRCDTGQGREGIMRYWLPQMALFQPIAIKHEMFANGTLGYRLSSIEEATYPETRFLCHFHDASGASETTFSLYPFNYEYISWRKHRGSPMFEYSGRDADKFEFSQLMFSCPVPARFRQVLLDDTYNISYHDIRVDVVPIRTPARYKEYFLSREQVGPSGWNNLLKFVANDAFGTEHYLPAVHDSGRWANLPVCRNSPAPRSHQSKPYKLALCTWTAASYMRRGDTLAVQDSAKRLKEWILFHRIVGVDHIYIYDNTQISDVSDALPLKDIAAQFPDFVTYHRWPAKICNNNGPGNKNPGERSSQYAAEASCRERYGALTEWMTFLDTDEYIVPMRNSTWHPILDEMSERQIYVLKMKSSRGKPRIDLMEINNDPTVCYNPRYIRKLPEEPCVVPRGNETFLRVYNCDYIKPPRPERFGRAMKQIYRPAFVLSHFVHYSTITTDIARYYKDWPDQSKFSREVKNSEWGDIFLDELTDGTLIHTKSVLPHETMIRNASCQSGLKRPCPVGYVCPESTPFNDSLHQQSPFVDEKGKFCNCWINEHLEKYWIPKLQAAMSSQ